jgi:hypothetical protein
VVYRQLRLALATTCSGHGVPLARVTCFFIIAAVVVCHGHNPLRTLLAPPLLATLDALLGVMDGDVEWRLLAATWGRLPTT